MVEQEARVSVKVEGKTNSESLKFSKNGIAVRLFFTCWLVYVLHFATDIVREHYPVFALGDHFSFRLDEYAGLHPDLFEKDGYGWHIGNNPGGSMLAAIPYTLFRPIIDRVVTRVQTGRQASGQSEPPTYATQWPNQRKFYKLAWTKGYDIKFGLAAFVIQAFCMAPVSALGVLAMFFLLRTLLQSDKKALWLSLLYAFATPVFFRTGFLNHNMMLGHITFMGFIAMWNPSGKERWSRQTRYFVGGLAGGTALLFDYSGVILLVGLFVYGLVRALQELPRRLTFRCSGWYILGSLGPILLLLFYQWKSFGNPFFPGQHWMPPVEWIERGYQGYGFPQLELLVALALDHRFGLFTSSPLMILAFFYLFKKKKELLPRRETIAIFAIFIAFWIFFSGSNYTRLQFNTGMRYMSSMLPFLFVPAALILYRFPRRLIYFIAVFAVAQSWCLAMVREVEHSLGLLNPILQVFFGGFKLPALETLSRMSGGQYGDFFTNGYSVIPLFVLVGAVIYGIWSKSALKIIKLKR